ncbi:MAG: DUF418 domain-containing protein [Spirochaetia bacterium]|nr:DUF418 domain-containing protein [Spirochaetia bacterium]
MNSLTSNVTETASPIAELERADVLDALRGFALLGILISHIPDFSGYSFLASPERSALDRFGIDEWILSLQQFLIRGKFFSLFSLLFGIGFAVQLEGAARRGAQFSRHFARRLAVLFVIGLLHAALWYGDILKDYALIGLILILCARWDTRRIAWVAACVLALRMLWPMLMIAIVPFILKSDGTSNPATSFSATAQAFGSGNPATIFAANLSLLKIKALQMVYDGKAISVLGMFFVGALIGKLGLYRNIHKHRRILGLCLAVCGPIGIIGNAFLVRLHSGTPDYPPTGPWVIEQCLFAVAVPALTFAYASAFALVWSRLGGGVLRIFALPGRMALTTYVSQTMLCIALFYGIGLGLIGCLGAAEGTLAAIAMFGMQCALAGLWLRYFRFGPLEWVWRRATYGRPISIFRNPEG